MSLPIVFMFSGQGSQYYHMGRILFEKNIIFKNWMIKADYLCQEIMGLSVIDHLYNNQITKDQPFTQTLLTHPAIFMVEYALMQVLFENNIKPDLVLGASMGEIAAATASGVLSFESALQLVIKQAQALEDCPRGGMLAVLHHVSLYQEQSYLHEYSELAAINFPSHFVVSGLSDNLKMIMEQLNENNILYQLLPVSHAFHSSLIDSTKISILNAAQSLQIKMSEVPLISCVEAKVVSTLTPTHFWDICRAPILFQSAIEYLESKQASLYLDLGPSGTLATFVKYNLSNLFI